MSFMDKVSSLSQNVSNKVKDTAGVVRINSQISDAEKTLNALYHDIGRKYCEIHGEYNIPILAESVEQVARIIAQIEQMRKQVNVLKGIVSCPKCNAQVKSGSMFCSSCGYQFPVVMKKRCRNCGCELNDDQAFCINCGTPVSAEAPAAETAQPAPVAETVPPTPAAESVPTTSADSSESAAATITCPTCGQQVPGDMNFCKYCGTKVK